MTTNPLPSSPNTRLARGAAVLGMAMLWTLMLLPLWRSELLPLLWRTMGTALAAGLLHGALTRWPVQVTRHGQHGLRAAGVLAIIPCTLLLFYLLDTNPGRPPLWRDAARLTSYYVLTLTGIMLAALGLLFEAWRHSLRLRRAQQAIDHAALEQMQRELHAAQLRLLRAQLKPQLVLDLVRDARDRLRRGAADGDAQLGRLLDYLQGALPRLDAQRTTLGEELELANGYLSLIAQQSPASLSWHSDIPEETLATPCPPRLLVVLVELAARLGLGLPDGGGRIDLWARMARGRCVVRVGDSGPLGDARHQALDALRRRLLLAEGESIRLQCWQRETGGSVVEVDFPCLPAA